MKIHSIPPEEVLKYLVVPENGLYQKEAERRLSEFGANEIREIKKKSLLKKLTEQFTHFLAILLWVAAFFCFLSEYLNPGEGMLMLGFAIIGVIVINAIFTFIQEHRAEKPSPEVMKQPPRNPKERLLNFPTLSRAYLFLGPIEAAAGLFGFFYVLKSGGWQWGETLLSNNMLYMQATTACLTAIIISQVGNVFACRSMRESVFTLGFFTNKLIFMGIAFEIILQFFIVYHPWGNKIFGTSPFGINIWLMLIPFGILLLFADELRKWVSRKKQRIVFR